MGNIGKIWEETSRTCLELILELRSRYLTYHASLYVVLQWADMKANFFEVMFGDSMSLV